MYRDDEKKFDIRVLQKHFATEDASREDIRLDLDSLPDVSSKIDTHYRFDLTVLPSETKAASSATRGDQAEQRSEGPPEQDTLKEKND